MGGKLKWNNYPSIGNYDTVLQRAVYLRDESRSEVNVSRKKQQYVSSSPFCERELNIDFCSNIGKTCAKQTKCCYEQREQDACEEDEESY